MKTDLMLELKQDYDLARARGERRSMDSIAHAISYAASGEADLAEAIALYQRGWNDEMLGRACAPDVPRLEYAAGRADARRSCGT